MIKKVDELRKTDDWIKDKGQFIPFPASWLNSKGWEDETGITTTTIKKDHGVPDHENHW